MAATVYFASAETTKIDPDATLPPKLKRMLAKFDLRRMCEKKTVAIKMHIGGRYGYTTVHPLFVRIVVDAVREAGGRPFVTDIGWPVPAARDRGLTAETLGAPIFVTTGVHDRYFYRRRVAYKTLKEIQVAGNIADADALIDLSHVKGHGDCGFGGACKNLAMGCVTGKTRADIHHLEGGHVWDRRKCIRCGACVEACRYGANRFDPKKNEYTVFYHHCTYCQHCVIACPVGALKLNAAGYKPFQEGMAIATQKVLSFFKPQQVLYVNFLRNITMLCDCWGLSFKPLVPDIGIMASTDLVAIDKASLDAIKVKDLIPGGVPAGHKLGRRGHLFERIHRKDPYVQIKALTRRGLGDPKYRKVRVD
jgi:uncharacterized Fe-S center protein